MSFHDYCCRCYKLENNHESSLQFSFLHHRHPNVWISMVNLKIVQSIRNIFSIHLVLVENPVSIAIDHPSLGQSRWTCVMIITSDTGQCKNYSMVHRQRHRLKIWSHESYHDWTTIIIILTYRMQWRTEVETGAQDMGHVGQDWVGLGHLHPLLRTVWMLSMNMAEITKK